MIDRTILKDLRKWAISNPRKPLILRGARQVGKTTVVDIFSKEFDQYIYLNLEKDFDTEFFKRKLPAREVLQAIAIDKGVNITAGRTLIFLDEIQNSAEAVTMLRYFFEDTPEYFFIAAGSLLEIMLENKKISFPVGRVTYLYMYPLTFNEFTKAVGENQALKYLFQIPCPEFANFKLYKLFHLYTLVGGMPEVVNKYIETQDIVSLGSVYKDLITAYIDDAGKYARTKQFTHILRYAIESVPFEAGRRIKFEGFHQSNYRYREMAESMRSLERAMLIRIIYPTTSVKPPLIPDYRKSPRLQYLDTGLLNFQVQLQKYFYQYNDLHAFYQGILAEHIAYQEIIGTDNSADSKPAFWVREKRQSNAEVDYLLQYKNILIPVEIKAGKSGTLRSLHQFIDAADHNYAIRLYAGSLKIEKTKTLSGKSFILLNLPYFLAGQLNNYADWFVKQNNKKES